MLAFKGLTNRPLVYLYNCTFLYYISADSMIIIMINTMLVNSYKCIFLPHNNYTDHQLVSVGPINNPMFVYCDKDIP